MYSSTSAICKRPPQLRLALCSLLPMHIQAEPCVRRCRERTWPFSGAWYAPTKRTRPASSTSHSAFTSFIIWCRLSCVRANAGQVSVHGQPTKTVSYPQNEGKAAQQAAAHPLEAIYFLHRHKAVAALEVPLVHLAQAQALSGCLASSKRASADGPHHAAGAAAQHAQDPDIPL